MKRLRELLKNKKQVLTVVVAAALGLILLLFPTDKKETAEGITSTSVEVTSYTEKLETRVRDICLAVEGVDKVSVLLTLESGSEYVYADNIKEEKHKEGSSGYTSDYLLVDSGDGEAPVLVREIYPRIRGVAVVCTGGDDAVMQKKLTELLSAALGLSANRIKISS